MSSDPKRMIKIARESGEVAAIEPLDLGIRVRELRKARGWTLEQAVGQHLLFRQAPRQQFMFIGGGGMGLTVT